MVLPSISVRKGLGVDLGVKNVGEPVVPGESESEEDETAVGEKV